MTSFQWTARNLADTDRLGAVLAEVLPDGTTVALLGTLGAGKTRLVQSVVAASGLPRESVVSPTFVLCQEYHGSRRIYHLDAYRLRDDEEFQQLGPNEYFESTGLVFVEWADRVAASMPEEMLTIRIEVSDGDQRKFEISATGDRLKRLLHMLQARLTSPQTNP